MISVNRMSANGAVALALLLVTAPVNAKTVLDPGLWQNTETRTQDGRPVKPKVTTDCMSQKDAEYPEKALAEMKNNAGQQCSQLDVRHSGNGFSVKMRCGVPKQFSMDIVETFTVHDRRHYSGRIKSTVVFAGRKSTGETQIMSKWIAASCKK